MGPHSVTPPTVDTSSVTPPTVVRLMFSLGWRVSMGPHNQCDSSHCREVDVKLGVVSQHESTQAVLPLHCREVDVKLGMASQRGSTQAV